MLSEIIKIIYEKRTFDRIKIFPVLTLDVRIPHWEVLKPSNDLLTDTSGKSVISGHLSFTMSKSNIRSVTYRVIVVHGRQELKIYSQNLYMDAK